MNRRNSIKSIFALGVVSVSSLSAYKWISLNREVDITKISSLKRLIAELADTIIPATDTPGAKAAGVENFIINVLANCTSTKDQNRFLNGIEDLEDYAKSNFGKSFINCDGIQREQIMSHFEDKGVYSYQILNKINNKFLGGSFFLKLKSLTVEGYCTSQIGATQGLSYDYIPGNFQGCIPLKPNQKSWATK